MPFCFTVQEEELSCPVCLDIFKHPVVLSCGHSSCKDCLQEWWTKRPTEECPFCQRTSSSNIPVTNYALQSLCENLLEQEGEKLKLFCLDCLELLCQDPKKHIGHNSLPVDEAFPHIKESLWGHLGLLMETQKGLDEAKNGYVKIENDVRVQACEVEEQYKQPKEREEKIPLLRKTMALKTERKKLKKRIAHLSRKMEIRSNEIQAVLDQLRVDDPVSFLQSYKTMKQRVMQLEALCRDTEPYS